MTPLPNSGRGGNHAWGPASAPCLPPAPTTTALPGRVHPLLPASPAPPPTRAAPSTAPTAPPVAPLPLPSDLAQMFDEPTGPGAAPAVPLGGLVAPTDPSSSWLGRLVSSAPRGTVLAVAGTPAGVLWAGLAGRWQGKAKRTNSSSASATSSAYSCRSSSSDDDSGPEPGNTVTQALPLTRAAPFAPPPTTAPTAPPVAPLPLPSDLAQMFDGPIGLSAAPTAPLATSVAPTVSLSSWLLDDIEVSDTPYVTVNVRTKYFLLTLTCVPVYLTQSRWHARRRCSRWISARQQSRR